MRQKLDHPLLTSAMIQAGCAIGVYRLSTSTAGLLLGQNLEGWVLCSLIAPAFLGLLTEMFLGGRAVVAGAVAAGIVLCSPLGGTDVFSAGVWGSLSMLGGGLGGLWILTVQKYRSEAGGLR